MKVSCRLVCSIEQLKLSGLSNICIIGFDPTTQTQSFMRFNCGISLLNVYRDFCRGSRNTLSEAGSISYHSSASLTVYYRDTIGLTLFCPDCEVAVQVFLRK